MNFSISDRFRSFRNSAVGVRVLVAAYAAAALTIGLGRGRVLTYHEVCFAQPAREMLAGADWLTPSIAGELFPDKPPLMHWSVAVSMAIFGECEFAARLPAALAGIGLAVLVAEFARRAFGAAVGLAAGGVQATAFYVVMQARLAECDMVLAFFVALALGLFGALEQGWLRATLIARCGVALATVAAFLCKGPLALAFVGGGIVASLGWRRSWESWRRWLHPLPITVGVVGVVAWPLAAAWRHPEIVAGWRRHNLDRFNGALGESASPLYYLGMIPLILLPWTPWVVVGLRNAWKERKNSAHREALAFTLAWLLPGLIVLSAAAWKHKHYAIPLLPPFSVWAGLGVVVWARSCGRFLPLKLAPRTAGAALFGGVAAVALVATQTLVPLKDSYRDQAAFAARVSNAVGAEPIFVPLIPTGPGVPAAFPENQIAFYLPLNLHVVERNQPPDKPFWMLAPAGHSKKLAAWGVVQTADRCATIRGLMKEEDRLTLFRITPLERTARTSTHAPAAN